MSDATPDTPTDPQGLLTAAARVAPQVLPESMGNAARLWLLAEADCHSSVNDVGRAAVDLVGSIDGPDGEQASFTVTVSTLHAALEFARAVLDLAKADEGSLRSQTSGTPAEVVAEALRDVRLNLGPNALESIYGGSNHLILSGAERRDIGLIAIQALIEAGLLPPSPHDMGRGTV